MVTLVLQEEWVLLVLLARWESLVPWDLLVKRDLTELEETTEHRADREREAPLDLQAPPETRATLERTAPQVLTVLLVLLEPLDREASWDCPGREERGACPASLDLLVPQESKDPQALLERRVPQVQSGLRD